MSNYKGGKQPREVKYQRRLEWVSDCRKYLESVGGKLVPDQPPGTTVYECGCELGQDGGRICERHKAALGKPK